MIVETPLTVIQDEQPKAANPYEGLSEEQLTKMITDTQGQIRSGQQANQPVQPQADVVQQTPQDRGQVNQQQATEQIRQQNAEPVQDGQQPLVEPNTDKTVQNFDELQQKTGIKSPDDLAKSYDNLVKKMTHQAQEISNLKRQQPVQPQYQQPVAQPQEQAGTLQEWVNNNIQVDPAGTIFALVQAMNKPILENYRDANFKSEITRLSSSPQTQDFASTPIQTEIQAIIEERPQKYLDNFGKVNPEALQDLYYMAKGRVLSKSGQVVNSQPQNTVNKFVPVEGTNKPQAQKSFDLNSASTDDIRNEILRIQRSLG